MTGKGQGGARWAWGLAAGLWLVRLLLNGLIVPLPVLPRWGGASWRPIVGWAWMGQPLPDLFLFLWWPRWLRATLWAALVGWTALRARRRWLLWAAPAAAGLLTAYSCCAVPLPGFLEGTLLPLHGLSLPASVMVVPAAVAAASLPSRPRSQQGAGAEGQSEPDGGAP